MKLSVIVPVYNIENYLRGCLDSLLEQGLNDAEYEVICINDGSKDGSLQILNEYVEKHKNVVVIDKENAGVSAARNDGLNAAKGKYIAFCDSDDCYRTNSLGKIVRYMEENHVQTTVIKTHTKVPQDFVYECEKDFDLNFEILPDASFSTDTVWSLVIEKSLIEKENNRFVSGMKYSEDTLFATQIYAAGMEYGAKVAVLHTPVYFYRTRIDSAMYQRNREVYFKDLYTLAKEYGRMKKRATNKSLKTNLGLRVDSLVSTILLDNLRIKKYSPKELFNKLTEDEIYPCKSPLWTIKDCPMKTKLLNIFKCTLVFKPIYYLCYAIVK